MEGLRADELAERAGADVAFIERLTEHGVLEPGPGGYGQRDIARVRIARAWQASGITPELLQDLFERRRFTMGWIDATYTDPVPLTTVTAAEAIEELGISAEVMERVFTMALQLPAPALEDRLREDDLAMLRAFALSAQLSPSPPLEVVANVRYFGENLRRLAESQVEAFRRIVMAPVLEGTPTVSDAIDTAVPIAHGMLELAEQTVQLLHRRHVELAGTEIVVENMELLLEDEGLKPRTAGRDPAIAFLDLSDSTGITERRGDQEALVIADGLTELGARAEAAGGRTVKFLGDGAMFHFAEPSAAVPASLELIALAPTLGLPAARVGIHAGPVLFRDGDYFGRTVIVAARVNALAGPREVLATEPVMVATADVAFEALGPVPLKGIAAPVPVFRASGE